MLQVFSLTCWYCAWPFIFKIVLSSYSVNLFGFTIHLYAKRILTIHQLFVELYAKHMFESIRNVQTRNLFRFQLVPRCTHVLCLNSNFITRDLNLQDQTEIFKLAIMFRCSNCRSYTVHPYTVHPYTVQYVCTHDTDSHYKIHYNHLLYQVVKHSIVTFNVCVMILVACMIIGCSVELIMLFIVLLLNCVGW